MPGILCFGEVSARGELLVVSREIASAGAELAKQLGEPLYGALIGGDLSAIPKRWKSEISRLYKAEGPEFTPYNGPAFIAAAEAAIRESSASVVLMPHTLQTREWAPVVASRLGTGLVTDCVGIALEGTEVVITKPIYGGSAIGQFVIDCSPKMATVRGGTFQVARDALDGNGSLEVIPLRVTVDSKKVTVLSEEVFASEGGPQLNDARIVVSGGRGIGGPENWHYIDETARALGAAVGCSRPVTDSGWKPSQFQVGLTGTSVAPEVYVAVGISGATQHLAGIAGARMVIAVNSDPDAAIFSRAQYGVVGDYREVLPAFVRRLREIRSLREQEAS